MPQSAAGVERKEADEFDRIERVEYEQMLYDYLTGLPTLPVMIERSRAPFKERGELVVLYFNFVRYSKIEEIYGWEKLDAVLETTAGAVRARLRNDFQSTNTANAFTLSETGEGDGVQFGLGVERKIAGNVSLGLEYLRTRIDDEDTRVRTSRGTAPLTNPFLLVNANGTDFRRSDERLELDTLQLTLNWRF